MEFLLLLSVFLPADKLVFCVRSDGSRGKVVDISKLFTARHEVLLVDNVDLEARIVIVSVIINSFFVHNLKLLILENKRSGVPKETSIIVVNNTRSVSSIALDHVFKLFLAIGTFALSLVNPSNNVAALALSCGSDVLADLKRIIVCFDGALASALHSERVILEGSTWPVRHYVRVVAPSTEYIIHRVVNVLVQQGVQNHVLIRIWLLSESW